MAESSQQERDIKTYRNQMINFVINMCYSKMPIKHSDLSSICEKNKKYFNECFAEAKRALKKVYGLLLVEVPDSKSAKKYICYSELPACSTLEYNENQKRELTLLFLILSYIFMLGGSVYEERIEQFLNGLKIYYDEEHAYFGEHIGKKITDKFVKQLYLTKSKSDAECDMETKFIYSWGFRSKVEFPKKLVLDATAKILERPKDMFIQQMEEAEAEDDDDGSQTS